MVLAAYKAARPVQPAGVQLQPAPCGQGELESSGPRPAPSVVESERSTNGNFASGACSLLPLCPLCWAGSYNIWPNTYGQTRKLKRDFEPRCPPGPNPPLMPIPSSASSFFGSFVVLARVGNVAYELPTLNPLCIESFLVTLILWFLSFYVHLFSRTRSFLTSTRPSIAWLWDARTELRDASN